MTAKHKLATIEKIMNAQFEQDPMLIEMMAEEAGVDFQDRPAHEIIFDLIEQALAGEFKLDD